VIHAPTRLEPTKGGMLAIYDAQAQSMILADEAVNVAAFPVIAVFLDLNQIGTPSI
jgi:hypothetical protein